jgi:transposase InsO family protein
VVKKISRNWILLSLTSEQVEFIITQADDICDKARHSPFGRLQKHGVRISMDGKGSYNDNLFIESVVNQRNGTLLELLHRAELGCLLLIAFILSSFNVLLKKSF